MKINIYIIILIILISCKEEKKNRPVNNTELKEKLIRANQMMAQKENEEINSFVKRHELKVDQTGTGLRYEIIEKGNLNVIPAERDTITLKYVVNLIDGTVIRDENSKEFKFIMGRAEVPKGLEEGLRLIGEGGKLILIMPSHLAYGRSGDDSTIPGNATLVVKAELLSVKKNIQN